MGAGLVGGIAGLTQTFVLRKYGDKGVPIIEALGPAWGQPSAVAGVVGGVIAGSLGALGLMKKGPVKGNKAAATGLTTYGVTALGSGIYSAMKPVVAPARLPAKVPTRVAAVGAGAVQPAEGVGSVKPVVMPYAQVPGQAIKVVEQPNGLVIRSLGQ